MDRFDQSNPRKSQGFEWVKLAARMANHGTLIKSTRLPEIGSKWNPPRCTPCFCEIHYTRFKIPAQLRVGLEPMQREGFSRRIKQLRKVLHIRTLSVSCPSDGKQPLKARRTQIERSQLAGAQCED